MILSRRSFLKVAGLSAVAVAGASMFTGCNVNNLFSTGVVYSAKEGSSIDKEGCSEPAEWCSAAL